MNFKRYFIEMCSLGFNWQYIIIGSDNGLALNRRQAIVWIKTKFGGHILDTNLGVFFVIYVMFSEIYQMYV